MPEVPVHLESAPIVADSVAESRIRGPAPVFFALNPPFQKVDYFGPGAPQWNALESSQCATLVKNGRQRKVWRVCPPQGPALYAKVFDDPVGSPMLWGKRTLGVHPAMREWNALMRLQALGVPVVRPIALARYQPSVDATKLTRGPGAPGPAHRLVLVTEEIEQATTLTAAWNAICTPAANRKRSIKIRLLTAAVAELWARAHQCGYAHPDGHPGNVLIEHGAFDDQQFARAVFIDPARSTITIARPKPVSRKKALYSLAMLDQYFHRSATRTERLRFWRAYWVRRDVLLDGHAERHLLSRLADRAAIHAAALARQRDRRLRGDEKYFARLLLPDGWRATVVLQPERRHIFPELDVPDRSVEQWAALCLQIVRIHHDQTLADKGLRLVCRPLHRRGVWAAQLFQQAHRQRHRDIPAPLILGYIQNKSILGVRDEYLILPVKPTLECALGRDYQCRDQVPPGQ